jgi:NET1-associated nuclear protein 1 (U3 small nucleolar RNA-associated protein 17)
VSRLLTQCIPTCSLAAFVHQDLVILSQCVAFDSTNTHIAAGDVSGRIIIWTGLDAAAEANRGGQQSDHRTGGMSIATIHWHAHPVGALCFSQDGLYLLSGGREAVLVIWQLQTLKKTFLPRLGGPISHITAFPNDPAKYAICQENNAVRLVAVSTMQVRLLPSFRP